MRALFCSFGESGYLYPLVGLALTLVERGHHVAFAAGTEAEETLHSVCLERLPSLSDESSFQLRAWGSPTATAADVRHIERALAGFPADILVTHQLCHGALIVRARTQIPTAVLGFMSYLWPVSTSDPAAAHPSEPLRAWRLTDGCNMLNAARALFGLGPTEASPTDHALLGDLFLLRTVRELEPQLADLPAQVHAVGSCLWEPPSAHSAWRSMTAKFVNPESPLVFVHQGRTFGKRPFWPMVADAVRDQPLQIVAETGRMDHAAGALPPNVVTCDRAPLTHVMPNVRAALSSGNTSAVLAAAAHGVPQLIAPSGGETPENALRLARARCAVSIAADSLTSTTLRERLTAMLIDADMHRACVRIQRSFRAVESFARAADLVEQLYDGAAWRRSEATPHASSIMDDEVEGVAGGVKCRVSR